MAELMPGEFLITRGRRAFDGPTDCRGEPLDFGSATRADLAELDAVPEPVDSDTPRDIHARTLARART